jgi:antibiotic biosynthesis monooxygenase (ABM) superfamily enzyme
MQVIYNYIPETNHVSRVYSVTAVLYLQSVLHVMLFRMLNMFSTFTLVLSAVCVQCQILLFYVVPLFRAFPVCGSGIL